MHASSSTASTIPETMGGQETFLVLLDISSILLVASTLTTHRCRPLERNVPPETLIWPEDLRWACEVEEVEEVVEVVEVVEVEVTW